MIGSPSVRKLHSNCFTPGEAVGSATCLRRWKYQNPPGDELKTPGIQSAGCLVTPDARADNRWSRGPEKLPGSDRGRFETAHHASKRKLWHLFPYLQLFFSPQGEIRVHA